jgi:hypothetical protein
MRLAGEDMMRRRKTLAEHPFGTLRCRVPATSLVRSFAKVRGEWSLMALCYNFSRVLSILGFDRWLAVLAVCGRDLPSLPNRPGGATALRLGVVANILYFLAEPLRSSALLYRSARTARAFAG